MFAEADPGFFLGGGALVSCSTSTPINHIVFLQNTSCVRKPQVISGRGWGAHPLHPSPRSAPDYLFLSLLLEFPGFFDDIFLTEVRERLSRSLIVFS